MLIWFSMLRKERKKERKKRKKEKKERKKEKVRKHQKRSSHQLRKGAIWEEKLLHQKRRKQSVRIRRVAGRQASSPLLICL